MDIAINDTFQIALQFCFDYGLSYIKFFYRSSLIEKKDITVLVKCDVMKIGTIAEKETVQVYLAPKNRNENQLIQELKGFEKVTLNE
ncbi:Thermostable beta-glucosidase B [Clostridiales bacterium CHKCI001]|nr:Thermostable beta-glucosidase B [Clostridiales bacterium CHKCI001]